MAGILLTSPRLDERSPTRAIPNMNSTTIRAHAAAAPHAAFVDQRVLRPLITPSDVEVEVLACAVCHSDLHLWQGDWSAQFPLVPGHEIVGRVVGIGSDVRSVAVGDRVGIGWQCGACWQCRECKDGEPQLCAVAKARTCVNRVGGFAEYVVADHRFVYHLPQALDSASAAPLMCAGLTVFSPLRRFAVGPGSHVGVVGFGGLGHLAVQFASALGASVVAFDPDATKEADAMACGAHSFQDVAESLEATPDDPGFDLLLTTTAASLDWNHWLRRVRIGGVLCLLGVPTGSLQIEPDLLLDGQRTITGSVVGSPARMREMLAFAHAHGVKPWVEQLQVSAVNEAMERLAAGSARYRLVLLR